MKDKLLVGMDEIVLLASSDGLLAAEVRMPPGGGPPVLHRHDAEEVYRVEAGRFAIYREQPDGGLERVDAGPGDVVHIGSRTPHTVRNEADAPARAYVVYSPGAPMEGFVRAAAALAADGPPALAAVLAVAERHGVEMTRPL